MKTELYSLSRLFSETILRIPDYQRGYSWTSKHLTDFWNDIQQLEEGKNHYTGVLTLENVPDDVQNRWDDDLWIIRSKSYRPYYIVDGQQRLTTALILVETILEWMTNDQSLNYLTKDEIRKKFIFESKDRGISRSYIFGYEKDNPSYEFLKVEIFQERSDRHSTAEETIYTHNLRAAKAYFAEKIRALSSDQVEHIFQKLTQRLLFNIYAISDDIDVCVAFETMNNRGKPLSALELLKNRLIYISTRLNVDLTEKAKLRSVINECWKTLYHFLGKNREVPLDDDDFLGQHFFLYFAECVHAELINPKDENAEMYENEDEDEDDLPESLRLSTRSRMVLESDHDDAKDLLLENIFTVRRLEPSPSIGTSEPILSLRSINDYAHSIKRSVQIYYRLFNPQDTDLEKNEVSLLEQHLHLRYDDDTLLLQTLYTIETRQELRLEILKLLERFRFIRKIIPGYVQDCPEVKSRRWAYVLLNRKRNAENLLAHLKTAVDKLSNSGAPKKYIEIWARKPFGFYSWTSLRYFLYEYEQALKEKSKTGRPKLRWEKFMPENRDYSPIGARSPDFSSIEHIYPQKVVDESWRNAFACFSVPQRNMLKQSLGNLIPLSKPKNSSLGNKSFEAKRGTPDNPIGYAYGSYSENEVAFSTTWTAKEILERGIRLLGFMEARWGVDLGDRESKIKILGLEFVESSKPK